jgi:alkylation response protein AidB-like acyl-CoA dehydrogenase
MNSYESITEHSWTPEQLQIKELAASVGRDVARKAKEKHDQRETDLAAGWVTLSQFGLAAMSVDPSHGGEGLGMVVRCIVAEQLGRNLAPLPFLSASTAVDVLSRLCVPDAATSRLPDLVSGKRSYAVVAGRRMLAPSMEGSNLHAALDKEGWMLTGHAQLVPEVVGTSHLLVLASAPDSAGVFEVAATDMGMTLQSVETLDLRRTFADVKLDGARGVRLDAGLIGAHLRAVATRCELLIAAESLGGALFCLEETLAHVKTRGQFGALLGSFQSIKHRLSRVWSAIESARELVYAGAAAIDNGTGFENALSIAARGEAAKALRLAVDEAIQFHGGMGFTWEHGIHQYFRRSFVSDQMLSTPALRSERLADALGV